MPQAALEAIYQAHTQLQTEGPFSNGINQWIQQSAAAMRQTLAESLHVPAAAMTLTEDVTVGCNIPLWGLDWQTGDRLLMTDCEHPGVIAAVQEISRRFHVEVDICPILATAQGGEPVAVIEAALQPRTRMLVVSHILWNTGQLLPLAELVQLCHDRPRSRLGAGGCRPIGGHDTPRSDGPGGGFLRLYGTQVVLWASGVGRALRAT